MTLLSSPQVGLEPKTAQNATRYSLSRKIHLSSAILEGLARVGEFLLISTVGMAVTTAYIPLEDDLRVSYLLATTGIGFLTVLIFQYMGLYSIAAFRELIKRGPQIVSGFTLAFLLIFTLLFFAKIESTFSRVIFAGWFIAAGIALLVERYLISRLVDSMSKRGLLQRRAAIVGGGATAARLIEELRRNGDTDLSIIGLFDDRTDTRSPDSVLGIEKLGRLDDLLEYARNNPLDLIIFAIPINAEARILAMLKKLCVLPIDIRLAAHNQALRFRPRNYSYIGKSPMLDIADKPVADWDVVVKSLFDRIIGTLMLIGLSPLMLLTAIAIKLESKGPVLFRQKRYGFNNELIEVYKFRSMYVDQCDATASKLVTKGDPRVTRVGAFIRKSSIDELPQLFNVVFKGNLSLVGPRPHAVHAKADARLYNEVVDGYFARHRVKPGITGWAQVNGWRGETDTEEKIQKRVEHDLDYIENWSVTFDAYILLMTPFSLIKTENAY
jgi:Undecaprenyl-phosphate glucose phosphotransferase